MKILDYQAKQLKAKREQRWFLAEEIVYYLLQCLNIEKQESGYYKITQVLDMSEFMVDDIRKYIDLCDLSVLKNWAEENLKDKYDKTQMCSNTRDDKYLKRALLYCKDNGIVAEFNIEIEGFVLGPSHIDLESRYEEACLSRLEVYKLLGVQNYGYFIHIHDLQLYEQPKPLQKYMDKHYRKINENIRSLAICSAIENYQKYILVPVKKEELNKILTGRQTIVIKRGISKDIKNVVKLQNYII